MVYYTLNEASVCIKYFFIKIHELHVAENTFHDFYLQDFSPVMEYFYYRPVYWSMIHENVTRSSICVRITVSLPNNR